MRCIIARELRLEYSGLRTAIRGWSTQPSLVKLESFWRIKKLWRDRVTLKSHEEEARYCNKGRGVKSLRIEEKRR